MRSLVGSVVFRHPEEYGWATFSPGLVEIQESFDDLGSDRFVQRRRDSDIDSVQ